MDLTSFLTQSIIPSEDTSTIDVFPLVCGIGKSTYIKHRLFKALNTNERLIIVTDRVDRLDDYLSDDILKQYILKKRDKLTALNAKNAKTELKTLHLKNIVLMTTQRYFNFTLKELQALAKSRPIIIFDEQPYFTESRVVNIKTFNDIDSALHSCIDNLENQEDKSWLITQWEQLRLKYQEIIKGYEAQNTEGKLELWHSDKDGTVTDNDDKFLKLIDKYKAELQKYNIDIYKNILTIYQIVTEGATFTSEKKAAKVNDEQYNNYFTLLIDNADKLTKTGAKIYVLDGTSDISPDYRQPYVNIIDCKEFLPSLEHLTINIVNISTSKNRFRKPDKEKYIEAIADYIEVLQNDGIIFTYKELKPLFDKYFSNVDYFGNIRGTNKYREYTNFVQVGLNRYPNLIYQNLAYFNKLSKYTNDAYIVKSLKGIERLRNDTMYNNLLTDIEQNLYRSKIRNHNNKDNVTYTILFNTTTYSELVKLIKQRYCKVGATVNLFNTPDNIALFKIENRQQNTQAKQILDWLSAQPKGRVFKTRDMLQEIGFTQKQFNNIKTQIPKVKQQFQNIKLNRTTYKIK